MSPQIIGIITLTTITLASCKISQEASLRPDDPWAPYEKAIDGMLPQDDFDYEEWEDNFDYDEFDSTR